MRRVSSNVYLTRQPRTANLQMFATELTYTGDCCRQTLQPPRLLLTISLAPCMLITVWLIQAVVLAHRPPISLPRTTVSASLLEELLGEISSLASVYHKPAETFIGQGKYGADAVQRQASKYVFHYPSLWLLSCSTQFSLDDEISSTQKALQNIVAGQQAENLLDFGDEDSGDGQLSGLAATTISATPAAANLLQNSSNPLDDLVSIFGGSGIGGLPSPQKSQTGGLGGLGGLSFGTQPTIPQVMATGHTPTTKPAQPTQGQDDLLGLF